MKELVTAAIALLVSVRAIGLIGGGEDEVATPAPDLEAELSLEITNIRLSEKEGATYYNYDITYVESNGVGVTITSGKACVQSTGHCNEESMERRIEPKGRLTIPDKVFYTSFSSDELTLTYVGEDDNGNPVSVQTSFSHPRN